jgi:Protein of unknown function (DUF3667)
MSNDTAAVLSEDSAPSITCKNCETGYQGKFCPQCGQKAKTARITLKQLVNEVRQHFIHYDSGYLHTAIALAKRPGHTVREYWDGKRVKLIKPVKFLILASTLNFIVLHYLGFEKIMIDQINVGNSPKKQQFVGGMMQFIFDHPVILQFILVPGLAFFSWLLLRRRKHNFAEHLVMMSFLMGELTLLSLGTSALNMMLIQYVHIQVMSALNFLIWAAYIGWAYRQIYAFKHWYTGTLRALLVVILSYVMIVFMSAFIAIILVIFFSDLFIPQ